MTNNEYAFSQVRSTIGLLNRPIAFGEGRLLIRGSEVRVPPAALGYAGQRPIWYLKHIFKNVIGPISAPSYPRGTGATVPPCRRDGQSRVIRTTIQKTSNSPPANSTSPTTYPSRWAVSKAATLCRYSSVGEPIERRLGVWTLESLGRELAVEVDGSAD
jgi:hypothetical protein